MTPTEFFNKYNGVGIDFDHAYGNQCMDLAVQYNQDVIGAPHLVGNAIDVWSNYPTDYYSQVVNSPTGVPILGDVVIWGNQIGQFGHIDVFVSGDASTFKGFDQNWPLQLDSNGNGTGVCHYQDHNYIGVLGWLHPLNPFVADTVSIDKATFEKLVTKSTAYDAFVAAGYKTVADVGAAMDALHADNARIQSSLNQANLALQTSHAALNAANVEIDALKAQIASTPNTGPITGDMVVAYLKKLTFWQRVRLCAKV